MHRLVLSFFLALFLLAGSTVFAAEKGPERVYVGAHINDIQEIDVHSHSYRLDLYVWYRWRNPAFDPAKTAEFMNSFDPNDHVRTALYDKPQKMPDGSFYTIIRDQGKFSAKFPLQKYPFDQQQLVVSMEDSLHPVSEQVYVPDDKAPAPVTRNAHINLPGFNIGAAAMEVVNFNYPTNFGDVTQPSAADYSRAVFSIPVSRPWETTGIKVFLPLLLIIFCTALVFFVHPVYIEGRLGVAITALLTLVALQLTSTSSLPDVDYLLMTDKIYLLSYLFIIATLMQLVRDSRLVHEEKFDAVVANDRRALVWLLVLFCAGTALVALTTL